MKHLIANWKMNFINSDAWLKDFDLKNIPKEIQVVKMEIRDSTLLKNHVSRPIKMNN